MGRKTSPALAKIWIRRKERDGWPIKKICEVYGISRSTFYRWYNKYKSGELSIDDNYLDIEELSKDLSEVEPSSGEFLYRYRFASSHIEVSPYPHPEVSQETQTSSNLSKRTDVEPSSREELPEAYNRLYLYLLPRDPYWAFAYWEVPPSHRQGISAIILRILDVTEDQPYLHYDVNVGRTFIGKWYLPIGVPARKFMGVLLGEKNGQLVELVRSNVIYLPRDSSLPVSATGKKIPLGGSLELKIDWAISSLADYLSSYYLWY